MRKLLLLTLLLAGPHLHAQQIPLSGSIGVPGSAPTLCGASVVMPSDANYTLTANQYACNSLNVTSTATLTATRNLLAPNTLGQQFTVTNATTGSQSLQVVASTGGAAVVPNGSTCVVNNPAGNGYVLASCTGSGGGGITALTGDVTAAGSGSVAATVVKVNGAAVPASQAYVGTNSSGQIVTAATPAGGVSSISSGNLSPLLTTSVATPTTTPAISYSLNAQAANTALLGPCTGASATPTFRTLCNTDIPAGSISSALSTGPGMWVQGDSICGGTGASNPYTNAWAYLLRPVIGGVWSATCRPGDQTIDTTSFYVNNRASPTNDGHYPVAIIEDGTNDVVWYGPANSAHSGTTSTTQYNSWLRMYLGDIYTQGIAFGLKSYPALSLTGWTASGSWSADTTQGGIANDYVSTTNGNTLAYAFTCAAACVGVFDYPVWSGNGGTFTLSLDGTPITDPVVGSGTTFYNAGDSGVSITATAGSTNSSFTKSAVRFAASAGSHTLTQTVTSATSAANKVGVNWFAVAPPADSINPIVLAVSLQHRGDGYDTLSGTATAAIQAMITQAASDGLNAYYADVRSATVNTNIPINLYVASTGTSYAAYGWVSDSSVTYAVTGLPLTKVSSAPAAGQYAVSSGTYTFNVADGNTPRVIAYTVNCGTATTQAGGNQCFADNLHPTDVGSAVYAAKIAATLPASAVTGNNVPQSTYPYRNYAASYQYPSQMATANSYNLGVGPATGFVPGWSFNNYVGQAYFETMTALGITAIGPNIGAAGDVFSVATYAPVVTPTSENQLVPLAKFRGDGNFSFLGTNTSSTGTWYHTNAGTQPYQVGFSSTISTPYVGVAASLFAGNSASNGRASTLYAGSNGTGALVFETGVGKVSESYCNVAGAWFLADVTTAYNAGGGTTGCTAIETMTSSHVHNFLFGLSLNGSTAITSTSSANSQAVTCATGGTGTQVCDAAGAWIASGGGFSNPMTTLGDTIYGGASGTATRLAGPTTTGHVFALSDTPASSAAVAPAWYDLTANVPTLAGNNTFSGVNTFTNQFTASNGSNQFSISSAGTAMLGTVFMGPTGSATSGANFNSYGYGWNAVYWNGSASTSDNWSVTNMLGSGTNPTSTFTFAHAGSPGAASVSIPYLVNTTSLLASGIVDGQAPITVTTGTTATLGGTYKSGYTFNEEATAGAAVTYTLPTAAAGLQYCVSNAYNGSAANTGALTLQTSASGQYLIFTDGTLSASGGYVVSGGAGGDSACAVAIDATHWRLYVQGGTWTKH